jgi:hypothetical protein
LAIKEERYTWQYSPGQSAEWNVFGELLQIEFENYLQPLILSSCSNGETHGRDEEAGSLAAQGGN